MSVIMTSSASPRDSKMTEPDRVGPGDETRDSGYSSGTARGGGHSGGGDCCPPVVDPYTWLVMIGGIALATYFLRVAIVVKMPMRRRRRGVDPDPGYVDGWTSVDSLAGVFSVGRERINRIVI